MDSEIGLNQILEFRDKLMSKWSDLDPDKVFDFIRVLRPRELNELWWVYKQAFYSSQDKPRDPVMENKLRQIIVKYKLIIVPSAEQKEQ